MADMFRIHNGVEPSGTDLQRCRKELLDPSDASKVAAFEYGMNWDKLGRVPFLLPNLVSRNPNPFQSRRQALIRVEQCPYD